MPRPVSRRAARPLVPEVVQTSGMDCGPATLACLLGGFGIRASYARLRDACHTDVDGTSIDAMQDAAVLLGLDAEQVMVPADHLVLAPAATLPAIVVTRMPGGLTHFVVVWRRHGPLLQVMDPAVGRRWVLARRFLAEVYEHELAVPAEVFEGWARSGALHGPLLRRLRHLGVPRRGARALLAGAAAAPTAEPLATLDAAARQAVAARRPARHAPEPAAGHGAPAGHPAASGPDGNGRRVGRWWRRGAARLAAVGEPADRYRFARAAGPGSVRLRGAVLVRVSGRRDPAPELDTLPPDLRAAVSQRDPRPGRFLAARLRGLGGARLAAGALVAALAAGGTVAEAVLFRALLSPGSHPGRAVAALVALAAVILGLDALLAAGVAGAGRRLETGLRAGLLRRLPTLPDRYVRSRPLSDLAERAHRLHRLRELPGLAAELVAVTTQLALLPVVIGLVDPASALPAVLTAAATTAAGFALVPAQSERDLRQRQHVGALARCYLDALVGLTAIRAHRGQPVVTAEHRGLLRRWAAAVRGVHLAAITAELVQGAVGLAGVAWLLAGVAGRVTEAATFLLLAYWAVGVPILGQQLGALARRYPAFRSVAVRLLEPLTAPAGPAAPAGAALPSAVPAGAVPAAAGPLIGPEVRVPVPAPAVAVPPAAAAGVEVRMAGVLVQAGGLPVLSTGELAIPAGSAVAVVGRSGSGKSTLAGLLLGWHQPAQGQLLVDGQPLDADRLGRLRRHTAWVDPEVTLWNRSLAANLGYAADVPPWVVTGAGLAPVAADLVADPDRPLGERGWLLSGGEAQRVRLGRAAAQRAVRLAVLDEPFRGLDRDLRRRLLARARGWWPGATLLFVTHDVADTLGFDRVLVVADGTVAEDGAPAELAARPGSAYRALLDAERDVTARLAAWRRIHVGAAEPPDVPVENPVPAGRP